MKFLIDANLPIRLARWLEGQGHDARHVAELPDGYETVDRLVWEVADAEERVVISKDVDFRDRQILTGSPKRLLRLRVGNISNADLLDLLKDRLEDIVAALSSGPYVELHRTALVVNTDLRQE